jgi:hypothetical protein
VSRRNLLQVCRQGPLKSPKVTPCHRRPSIDEIGVCETRNHGDKLLPGYNSERRMTLSMMRNLDGDVCVQHILS